MTYAEIVAAVKAILIEPIPAATVTYIDSALHSAQRKLEDRKVFKCCHGATSLNTITQATFGIFEISAFYFGDVFYWNGPRYPVSWKDGEDGLHQMEWVEVGSDLYRRYSTYGEEGPPAVAISMPYDTEVIQVYPWPDTNNTTVDGSYDITFHFWKRLWKLSEDEEVYKTNWFSVNCEDYLVWQTAAECFLFDRDYQGYAVWGAKATGEYRRLVKNAKRGQFHGTVLKPRTDANAASTAGRR